MTTGNPIKLKCPKCRRGQWRRAKQVNGVITAMHEKRERVVFGHRRRGGRTVIQRKATCLDCGHVWWTTFFDQVDKVSRAITG